MANTTFNKEEKAAMRAAAAEAKAAQAGADLEAACLSAIAQMSGLDQELASALHELVRQHTSLRAKTWYGMPAYANAEGKVVVFFQAAAKFQARYATVGFQADAHLDAGNFWPTSFALIGLDAQVKGKIVELLQQAVS